MSDGSSTRSIASGVVYAAAAAVQRGLLFVLLPLVTRVMSPAEYGELSVLLAVTGAAASVLAFGLDFSVFRVFFELRNEPERQQAFLHSVWRFLVVVPLAAALSVGLTLWAVFGGIGFLTGPDLLLALLGAATFVAGTSVPLSLFRAEQRLRDYLIVISASALLAPGLILLLVVVLGYGVTGWLLAVVLANLVTLGLAVAVVPWRSSAALNWNQVRGGLALGIPLLPHNLSQWALNLADRLILAGLVSATALGVYSLAANLALPVVILVQSLNQGLMPTYARAGSEATMSVRLALAEVVNLQVALVLWICTAGALVAPPLVGVMAPTAYSGAASLTGWLILGYCFLGLYFVPMNGVTLGARRNRMAWVATVVSAAINIALIFALVPALGLHGAAVASAIGYAVLLVGISIYARGPDNPVHYDWRTLLPILLVCVVAFIGGSATVDHAQSFALAGRVAWAGIAILPLVMLVRRGPSPHLRMALAREGRT